MAVLPRLRVARSEALTPRMQRIVLAGDALRALDPLLPTQHVRLLFGEPGEDVALPVAGPSGLVWPADRPRPFGRSMTVRRLDRSVGEIVIDVALHGATASTRWATGVVAGDPVGVVGPGGGYIPPADADVHLIAGDETALPAIATLLATLPPERVHVVAEVGDGDDEQDLGGAPGITWVHRARGENLVDAIRSWTAPTGRLAAWVAGEGHDVRTLREHLRADRSLERTHCHAIRYWTRGRTHEDSDVTFDAARDEARRRGIDRPTTQDVHEVSYDLMTGGFPLPVR